MSLSLRLPLDGGLETYELVGEPVAHGTYEPATSRLAFAAAHVVSDPSPTTPQAPPQPSTGTTPSASATTSGPSACQSQKQWTQPNAAWDWTGPPRKS